MAVTRGQERGRLDLLPWNCLVGGSHVFVFVGPDHDFGEHLNHRVIDWKHILTPQEISHLFKLNSFLVMMSTGEVAGMCGNESFSFHDALVLKQTGLQALNGYDRYGDMMPIISLPIATAMGSCAGVAAMVVPKRLVPLMVSAEWISINLKNQIVGIQEVPGYGATSSTWYGHKENGVAGEMIPQQANTVARGAAQEAR